MTKIALIDDHTIFCDSLSSLVNEFEGFSVCWTAHDGAGAIRLLEQNENVPDIVLLDIVMPGMSGIEVAKWIFENKRERSECWRLPWRKMITDLSICYKTLSDLFNDLTGFRKNILYADRKEQFYH
jgi:CheY-like chemotaxis protein